MSTTMHFSRLRYVAMVSVLVGVLLVQAGSPMDGRQGDRSEAGRAGVASAQGQDWTEKIDGRLRALGEQARAGNAPTAADADRAGVTSVRGRLRVVVEGTGGARSGALSAARYVGGQVEAEHANLVQLLVSADRLADLANDPGVRYVRTPFTPVPRAIAGEGVQSSGAAAWHAANITGAGVKVAVFDSGFTGLDDRKAQGDIPQSAQLVDLCNGDINSSEHGTGVAEIVHEMAPGAQLLLYCVGGDVQLGQAKDQAKAAGAHVISMSLAYFNTSRGDGSGGPATPEGIVADARNSGILWVNSAGNASAGEAWYGPWTDADTDGYLDWAPGDRTNTVQLPNGGQACGYLSWDAWPATGQDFALEIHDANNFGTLLTPANDNPQTGTQAPVERTCYTNNTGAERPVDFVVRRVNANPPLPPRFQISVFNQRLEHFKDDQTIDLPATSPSAVAVGAVCWQTERLEDYSSRGPTIDGRIKPDISAQSVVSSGAYGPWQACPANADGQGGFNGTSAAAPHVAGAAALVKSANPAFGPGEIQAFLEGRSRDKGAPGKDNLFGTGLLTLGAPGTNIPTSTPTPTSGPGGTATPTATTAPSGPAVTLNVTKVATNRLQVTLTARPGQTLQRLAWTLPANASAETTDGAAIPTGLTLPAGATSATFHLIRTGGTSVTLPIVVTGSFGEWRTFVGGGSGAW